MSEENIVEQIEVAEEAVEQQAPQGILYDYSVKLAEKLALKEKRKTAYQALKYFLCATSAGIIQMTLFAILQAAIPESSKTIDFIVEMPLTTFIATTVALCASILWNFTLNRKFTFKDAGNVPLAMFLAFLFYVPFYPFQTYCMNAVKEALIDVGANAELAGIVGEATAMVCNFVLEFLWQKFVVFRKPKDKKKTVCESEEASIEIADDVAEEIVDSVVDDIVDEIVED